MMRALALSALLLPLLLVLLLVPVLVPVLFVVPVFGDEEAAKFFTERGNEALAQEEFKDAREHFVKALSEQEGHLPAEVGLAQAHAGLGEKDKACRLLAKCIEREAEPGLDSESMEAIQRAGTLLAELDPLRMNFDKLIAGLRKKIMALAEEHLETDPDLARLCLERLLLVDPECAKAKKLLSKLKNNAGTPGAGGVRTEFFDGKSLEGWTATAAWSVLDGRIVGRPGDGGKITWSNRGASGDFAVEFELRTMEGNFAAPMAVVGIGLTGKTRRFNFGIMPDCLFLGFEDGSKRLDLGRAKLPDAFDSRKWNTYRLAVEGLKLTAWLNGSQLFSYEAKKPGTFDGAVFLVAQHQTIEVRRVTLFD